MNIPPITPIIVPLAAAVQQRVLAPAPATMAVTEHPAMPTPRKEPVQSRDKRDREQEDPRRKKQRRARGARADLQA